MGFFNGASFPVLCREKEHEHIILVYCSKNDCKRFAVSFVGNPLRYYNKIPYAVDTYENMRAN